MDTSEADPYLQRDAIVKQSGTGALPVYAWRASRHRCLSEPSYARITLGGMRGGAS